MPLWMLKKLQLPRLKLTSSISQNTRVATFVVTLYFFQPKRLFLLKGNQLEIQYLNMVDDEVEFDFEIATQLKDEIQKISNIGEKVKHTIQVMNGFINDIRNIETRKEKAECIQRSFNNRSSFVFSLLDGKELTSTQLIKLMHLNNINESF